MWSLQNIKDYILKLIIPLTTVDDDLRYEGESWQEQAHNQEDYGEVEMFHCQWLNFLLLIFLFEWSFIYQQTSQESFREDLPGRHLFLSIQQVAWSQTCVYRS